MGQPKILNDVVSLSRSRCLTPTGAFLEATNLGDAHLAEPLCPDCKPTGRRSKFITMHLPLPEGIASCTHRVEKLWMVQQALNIIEPPSQVKGKKAGCQ